MATTGISTLGVLLGYGTGSSKPATFTKLTRINSIGGIDLSTEQIDSSALEDLVSCYVAGRQDTGGTWDVTVNLTDATITEWETVITAYEGLSDGAKMWFEVYSPELTKGFFVIAQPPKKIPMPSFDQNGLATVTMSLTINEYKGLDTGIAPTAS